MKTTQEMIQALIDQVDDMDLETIVQLAKAQERAFYESKTDAELMAIYAANFPGEL